MSIGTTMNDFDINTLYQAMQHSGSLSKRDMKTLEWILNNKKESPITDRYLYDLMVKKSKSMRKGLEKYKNDGGNWKITQVIWSLDAIDSGSAKFVSIP
jgi:hypothetical protein